jgi:negative regulator of sigma-B (phosphoserine phosphatase)
MMQRCHEQLRSTRGAVLSIAAIDGTGKTVTWLGVGNVEGIILRNGLSGSSLRSQRLLLRPGIVGYRLPSLEPQVTPISPGDLVILTTDGIAAEYDDGFRREDSPRKIAEYISWRFRRGQDDGLVLVARYLGCSE